MLTDMLEIERYLDEASDSVSGLGSAGSGGKRYISLSLAPGLGVCVGTGRLMAYCQNGGMHLKQVSAGGKIFHLTGFYTSVIMRQIFHVDHWELAAKA
jgi:hypothetical protein